MSSEKTLKKEEAAKLSNNTLKLGIVKNTSRGSLWKITKKKKTKRKKQDQK